MPGALSLFLFLTTGTDILCSVLPCINASDAANLTNWVSNYTSSSAQFTYNGQALVSTFAGESCTFGAGSVAEGWQSEFTSKLSNVLFVPSFMVDPSTFNTYSQAAHGQFNVCASGLILCLMAKVMCSGTQPGQLRSRLVVLDPLRTAHLRRMSTGTLKPATLTPVLQARFHLMKRI